MKEHYHHGQLKKELIEVSIRIISEQGFDGLSLRNISRQCGVSHNAIYRHFDNKEQLIDCCRNHVTKRLTEFLNKAIEEASNPSLLNAFCLAYITFYKDNPTYFSFLYKNSTSKIIFTTEEIEENYPPFEVLRKVCYKEMNNATKDEILAALIKYWSLAQGAASLIISSNIETDENLEKYLKIIFS